MATSAFRSTTKRAPIGKSSPNTDDSSTPNRSSAAHRRHRSLSRFSHRLPELDPEETPSRRGRFVNTVRGSGSPEISLDDLAIELFDSLSGGEVDRGRSNSRKVEGRPGTAGGGEASGSQRRGRSVSRVGLRGTTIGDNCGGKKLVPGSGNSRRRRSVSAARKQITDYENDLNDSRNSRNLRDQKSYNSASNKIAVPSDSPITDCRPGLRRSSSQKDLNCHNDASSNVRYKAAVRRDSAHADKKPGIKRSFSQKDLKYQDGYSSQSSALTDDEGRIVPSSTKGTEKTIRTMSTREKLMGWTKDSCDDYSDSKSFDVVDAFSTIRRDYTKRLEESEKRKKDLLADIMLEEQHSRELSKVVKEFLADPKDTVVLEKPSLPRKRNSSRSRMPECLTDEAERYIEEFLSSIEDTDLSSLDGERSETSSAFGGIIKAGKYQSPAVPISKSIPVEMEGLVLPWLQWETSTDSPPLCKNKPEQMGIPKYNLWGAAQECSNGHDISNHSSSSQGSWSPDAIVKTREDSGSKSEEAAQISSSGTRRLRVDVDDYLKLQNHDDLLREIWKQRGRISSGRLFLCNPMWF